MVKAKRPDRAVKCKERWTTEETVVKSKLNSALLSTNKDEKEKFLKAIRDRVLIFSKRYHVMSLAMNVYIRECFHNVKSKQLQHVAISEIFEQTFIRQMMLGTSEAQKPISEISDFYKRHPDLLDMLELDKRHYGDRNIYSAGGKKYLTNLKNHLFVNLHRWMKCWIYSSKVEDRLKRLEYFADERNLKVAYKSLFYDLNGWDLTDEMKIALHHLPLRIKKSLELQKNILGPKPLERKEAYDSMLRYVVFINKFIEKYNPEKRKYNLAPVGRIRCHYITIDTSVLGGITKECEISSTLDVTKEMWETLLNFKRLEGRNCTFTGTIDTDGTAVCVHFKRPKRIVPDKSTTILENGYSPPNDVCVVGIDPGRKDISHAVIETSLGVFKSVVLTRNQYYKESGTSAHLLKTEVWQKPKNNRGKKSEMEVALESLSTVSTKGNSLESFMNYLKVWKVAFPILWNEYTKPRWSEGRFRLYGGKKRVFANYFNRLENVVKKETGKDRVVISYGSAKFAPTGKGEVAVPTSRCFKECRTRFETHVVTEFRTSMVYHKTLEVLKLVGSIQTGKEIRGLRWCCSTNQEERKVMISRDQNAAINIRNILIWGRLRRPDIFCRGHPPLQKRIGRWLLR